MESKGIIEINGGSHSGSSGRSTPNIIPSEPSPGKLFVGGLSWQTSCERLREYFGMFGNVTDVLIMKDPVSQRSRGFGFITFSDPSSVDNVLKVPIHTIDGKKVDPKHATPKNRPKVVHRTKKIFVGGVSQDTSSEEVRAYFVQFGKVEDASLLMDQQTKRHRGFGFVTFESEDVVETVVDIHFHTIKNKKVECKKAQPKENVSPANQLVGKRLMINNLGGLRVPVAAASALAANPLVVAQAAQAHAHAQAQAQAAHAHAHAHAQAQAHAFAAHMSAAQSAAFGKVFSPYPPLASYRYSPYAIPTMTANVAPAPPQAQPPTTQGTPMPQPPTVTPVAPVTAVAPVTPVQPVQSVPNVAPIAPVAPGAPVTPVPPGPYQGYNLANIDMSSFQGIDWASLYPFGGMYG